jgi:hypothetical protein
MDLSKATLDHPTLVPPVHPLFQNPFLILCSIVAFITTALIVYSVTIGFVWDEGFHLLAAQFIANGKVPYIDFCFPQTPLNAYWNAAWMRLFGQGWRVTHVVASLELAGAIYLSAGFVFTKLPIVRWRLACSAVVAFLICFNTVVVRFGPIAQAYAIGTLFCVVAFRFAVATLDGPSLAPYAFAGVACGIAAGSTLLTVPLIPVLVIWFFIYASSRVRLRGIVAFILASLIPFSPVFWLFVKGPRQTFFNVIQYQALFRRVNWNGATVHDIDVLSSWINSGEVLCMGILGVAGIYFVVRNSAWPRDFKASFYLCAWLTLGFILYISTAHPTFERYYMFAVPFASVIGSVGLCFLSVRLSPSVRTLWPALIVIGFMTLVTGRSLFEDRDSTVWKDYDQISAKILQITPPGSPFYADEQVYFITKREPPAGLNFSYAEKLQLTPAQEALYHTVSERELNQQVSEGKFATVETCKDERIDDMNLPRLFKNKVDIADCSIFWDFSKPKAALRPGTK